MLRIANRVKVAVDLVKTDGARGWVSAMSSLWLCALLVCLAPPSVRAQAGGWVTSHFPQTMDCVTKGFKKLGTSGESPIYPVDPSCYKEINPDFYLPKTGPNKFNIPYLVNWNTFAVVNSCFVFPLVEATNGFSGKSWTMI